MVQFKSRARWITVKSLATLELFRTLLSLKNNSTVKNEIEKVPNRKRNFKQIQQIFIYKILEHYPAKRDEYSRRRKNGIKNVMSKTLFSIFICLQSKYNTSLCGSTHNFHLPSVSIPFDLRYLKRSVAWLIRTYCVKNPKGWIELRRYPLLQFWETKKDYYAIWEFNPLSFVRYISEDINQQRRKSEKKYFCWHDAFLSLNRHILNFQKNIFFYFSVLTFFYNRVVH